MENFVRMSLETHLFFARIMKEHSFFLEAGFPCADEAWIKRADRFREEFEDLLSRVVRLANGMVSSAQLQSGELVTEFTLKAEKRTEALSGVPFNTEITRLEERLRAGCPMENNRELRQMVHRLNERSIHLLNGLIGLKEDILREVADGKLFTANYPLLIQHVLREAKLYRATIESLMNNRVTSRQDLLSIEEFWNRIMMEHAFFIRGLLDPAEEQLIDTADDFAEDFKKLLAMAKEQDFRANEALTKRSLAETMRIRDFKAAGTKGILNCEIASIMVPLLADHVLREANHYIRLLTTQQG